MSTSALVKLQTSLQARSLADLVAVRKAERQTYLALDTSTSMSEPVGQGSVERKIDALRNIAASLRRDIACPQFSFGAGVSWIAEYVPEPAGSTPLHDAIDFAKKNGAKRLVIVSDGEPDSRELALQRAKEFGGPIDVFYVGPRPSSGETFLEQLAEASGGKYAPMSLSTPKQLTSAIRGLLPPLATK